VLTTRKLLILNEARRAKKAPLSNLGYNLGTVIFTFRCGNWGQNSLGESAAGLVLGTQLLSQALHSARGRIPASPPNSGIVLTELSAHKLTNFSSEGQTRGIGVEGPETALPNNELLISGMAARVGWGASEWVSVSAERELGARTHLIHDQDPHESVQLSKATPAFRGPRTTPIPVYSSYRGPASQR
jgi:hypothetical protein